MIFRFYNKTIIRKEYSFISGLYLYFEKSQHLNFLFKKKINYENQSFEIIRKLIKKGDLVFDIGGNIGQYALVFSKFVFNEGKVISFEPDPKNFAFLQFNINMNRLQNVIPYNIGVGSQETQLKFYSDSITGGRKGSFKKNFVGTNYKGDTTLVNVKTLDNLIELYGTPKFIKIDVEGFENEVIRGLKNFNNRETIFFVEVRNETKNEIFEFFNSKNYSCYCLETGMSKISNSEEIPSFANLLFKIQ